MSVTRHTLTLATLCKLFPHVEIQMAALLKQAVSDARDRPAVEKSRVIGFEVHIWPGKPQETGALIIDDVMLQVRLKPTKLPTFETRELSCGLTANDEITFNEISPDNVHQRTLDEEIEGQNDSPDP